MYDGAVLGEGLCRKVRGVEPAGGVVLAAVDDVSSFDTARGGRHASAGASVALVPGAREQGSIAQPFQIDRAQRNVVSSRDLMRHQEGGSKRLRHIGVCASDGDGQIGHISYGAAGAALGAGDTGQADSVSGQFVDVVIGVVAGVLPKARSGAESFQCRLDRRADPVDGQCHGDVRGGSHGAHVDTPSGLGW